MTGRCRFRLGAALVAVGLLCGCTNGADADDTARDAAIYRSVIIDVVDRSGVDLTQSEDLPVLFLEALGSEGIPLQVQVEVVAGFIDRYEIRFIDHQDEALDVDLPGLPVRAGSLLIGLGDIDIDGSGAAAAEVHSELYLRTDDVRGFSYTVEETGPDEWGVVAGPVDVEPRGLVPEP